MKLTDQYAAVQREIKQRERVYPRLVAKGTMSQAKADHELAAMRAVLVTVEQVMLRGIKEPDHD